MLLAGPWDMRQHVLHVLTLWRHRKLTASSVRPEHVAEAPLQLRLWLRV